MKKKEMKFSSIVRSIILEQGRYEILKKTYTQPKKKGDQVKPARMSVEDLDKIVLADPTTRRDGDIIKKAGTYTPWLLKQYLKLEPDAEYGTPQFKSQMAELQRLFFEDLYKTTEDLQKFDRFKGQLDQEDRDINKHTIDSLMDITADFSLEKTKASKEEKQEASKTYEHPGGEVIFRGSNWTVVKIEDQGELGKDAACFYGGHGLRSSKGESSWCTSAPGLSYFNTYIKQGPLYVVIPNKPTSFKDGGVETGEKSGLPARRYQFHFPSNQFMDPDDRQIDLVNFLNENAELKEVFKPEFMKGLTNSDGTVVSVEYPNDSASKFIALYGFDEFFDTLPDNLERLDFVKGSRGYGRQEDKPFSVKLPSTIGRFKNLNALHLEGIVDDLPKELGELKDLVFLSLPNNPNLTELPVEIAGLDNLQVINLKNSPNVKIPDEIEMKKGAHIFR
jgi:hypothetical protein